MNYGLILAGGVGQRMRSSGMPKQFLEVFGKPIIVYTLEKFERCVEIDATIIACNAAWIDYLNGLINKFSLKKVTAVIAGGKDRQGIILNGVKYIQTQGARDNDIVVIHDGVRPLVQESILSENVRIALEYGSAITARPVVESVVITNNDEVSFESFQKRDDTYSLTSPQTFQLKKLMDAYCETESSSTPLPFLDSALMYTYLGNNIHIIKESNQNLKITTAEDYYILKAMLELQENKAVFGI